MTDLLIALVLGVVQGITEFLPISSSGHLLLGQYFFRMDPERFGLTFDVALHFGSLIAVLLYFRDDVRMLWHAFRRSLPRPDLRDTDQRLFYLLVVATIPASVLGFVFRETIETGLRSPWVVVAGLTVFGVFFIIAEHFGSHSREAESIQWRDAVGIGFAQAIALLPGVSRSGSTISFGVLFGLTRQQAARFSFLMSIPITAGAIVVQLPQVFDTTLTWQIGATYLVGMVVSGVVAYLSITFLLALFRRFTLRVFAYYGFIVSAIVSVLLLLGY